VTSSRARSGRRPGGEDTRGAILEAARAAFATAGYQAATIRAIAAEAGVDPALVHHYFGTKEDLFGMVMELPLRPSQAAEMIMAQGIENAGSNLARLFFSIWESPATRDTLLAMLRGAFTTEQGAETLKDFFEAALLERVADQVDGPDAKLRVSLAASHLIGVAVLRYVIGFEELIRPTPEELAERVGGRIQAYFTP
jgi:AcrR family transcriptional regulator